MEKFELFYRLKVLIFNYNIEKYSNDNVVPIKYFNEAEIFLQEIDTKKYGYEFLDYLDYLECVKFSLFVHDLCLYQIEDLKLLTNGLNNGNIENISKDFKNTRCNTNPDSSDLTDTIRAGRTNPENVSESRETPIVQPTSFIEETPTDNLNMHLYSLERNFDEINANSASWQPNLMPLGPTPHLPDMSSLTDTILQSMQENANINELSAELKRLRNLQLVLSQKDLNTQNARYSQNNNLLFVNRRATSTPRISSIHPRRISRRIILNQTRTRTTPHFFLIQDTVPEIDFDFETEHFHIWYIPSFKEREYVEILDLSNIEINLSNTAPLFTNNVPILTSDVPLENENNIVSNLVPMCEDISLRDLPPISSSALCQSYNNTNLTQNIHSDTRNRNRNERIDYTNSYIRNETMDHNEIIDRTNPEQNVVHQFENVAQDKATISTKGFYGANLSTIREYSERIQSNSLSMNENLIISVVNLPRIPVDNLYQNANSNEIINIPAESVQNQNQNLNNGADMLTNGLHISDHHILNEILVQRSPINTIRYIDILRQRNPNINYVIGGTCPQLRRKRRKRRRRENIHQYSETDRESNDELQVNNRNTIQEFKNLQEEFMKYDAHKYTSLPKFDFDSYTDLYEPEELTSIVNILKLLTASPDEPVPRNLIFPNEITQNEINLRHKAIKGLTELHIAEILNDEQDINNDDNFSAIKFKSTILNANR